MATSPKRPNLLFLFTDEQRADSLAAYGNDRIEMPNLNRLAATSTVFERGYVTQPVCTPARSSIMTGLYPHTNGCIKNNIPLDYSVPTIAELLKNDSYYTGYHGKWHLGDEVFLQHGFDEWRSIEDMYTPHYREGRDRTARSDYHHWLVKKGIQPQHGDKFGRDEATSLPEEHGKPAFLGEEGERFLRERAEDGQPFMLYVNFLEPHMPFFGPRDDQYDPNEISLPPNFDDIPDETRPLRMQLNYRRHYEHGYGKEPLRTEADWRALIAKYWGLCSLVDTHAGCILNALEETGLAKNTIVVHTSDHGDMMGSHRTLTKGLMQEEATRVPYIIRAPGQTEARVVSDPVSQIDLVPTLLDLMGYEAPEHLQGKSLADAVLNGGTPAAARDVIIQWNARPLESKTIKPPLAAPEDWQLELGTPEELARSNSAQIRTIVTQDRWKFAWQEFGDHELYNLTDDPYETKNLARDPGQKDRMVELSGRISAWQRETGDPVVLPEIR